jgi:Concanavalin A-like lectin/glucanases superfamily
VGAALDRGLLVHPPSAFAYALYASDTSRSRAEVFSGDFFTAFGPKLETNSWTHLATAYSGGSVRLYVNGTLAATTPVPGPLPNSSGPLRIGGNSMWGEYFSGLIDEVRVYDRALSAAEIQTDMDAAIGP